MDSACAISCCEWFYDESKLYNIKLRNTRE